MATRTRWLPVLGVLVLAPWFAEMAWGGYPFTDIPVILLFLAPLYGAAALLIREAARRTGRGWPTILLLAGAFGVLQAGIVDQSLFNPAYDRYDFQHPVHVDGIDISLYYLVAFVAGHVVASIATPIAIAEIWTTHDPKPWLSRRGLRIVAMLYVLAAVVNHLGVKDEVGHGFQASASQVLVALAVVVVLAGAGMLWRRPTATASRVPRPWIVTAIGFVAYLLYLPGEGAGALVVAGVVALTIVAVVGGWSRSRQWNRDHTTALALGAVLTGLVTPFWSEPYDNAVSAATELTGDVAAASICLTIVVASLWRHRSSREPRATSGP